MTCTYDTRGAASDVVFGDLTQNEMCWSAMMYYPSQGFTSASYANKWATLNGAEQNTHCDGEAVKFEPASFGSRMWQKRRRPHVGIGFKGRGEFQAAEHYCSDNE